MPYSPETEVSYFGRYLPAYIQNSGREIRTFMPRFSYVNERKNQLHEVIRLSGMNLIISNCDHQLIIKVGSISSARMQVYFIDNEEFFKRRFVVKDDAGNDFADNDERAIFFARGVLETVKKLRWTPDIIHCHGWMSAIVPIMVKKAYHDDPFFENSKVVYSLYNDEFTTPMPDRMAEKVLMNGIEMSDLTAVSEKANYETLSKLAMEYSDGVIQASETVNANLLEDIKKSQKLFLPYVSEENYVTSYNEFYDKVLEK